MLSIALSAVTMFAQSPLAVRWEMGRNDAEPGYYSSRFVLKNVSGADLGSNWEFFFNQFSRSFKLPATSVVDMNEVSTTYYHVTPNANYKPIAPGDSIVIDVLMRGTMVNISYAPQGGHVVLNGDYSHPRGVKIEIARLDTLGQWVARKDYPDGKYMYEFNRALAGAHASQQSFNIFPQPKQVDYKGGNITIPSFVTIKGGSKQSKRYLERELKSRGIYTMGGQSVVIKLGTEKKLSTNPEYYMLDVSRDVIMITGAADEGLLNGVKTLIAALDHSQGNSLSLAVVKDFPDLHYRGFMLDIARNFMSFDNLKRFVDLLAYYKINRYQFHFTDDEAWRVEIPGIPELTDVASRRGCTLTEKGFLAQIFDGNGNPDDLSVSANGYLTRAQMVELLRYAADRGVKIIPEIETPGHARAAIVAMKNRYEKYKDTNLAEAVRYQLWDEAETRSAVSVQAYKNNVLNVAKDGVYAFLDKVITELEKMYKDAGLKLDIVHLGGDEVAVGAWDYSPAVKQLKTDLGLKNEHEVSEYYMRRITDILYKRGIRVEGWQEVAMGHSAEYNKMMTPRFAGVNAWSTVGKRDTVPYTVANSGYPTILSNVTNFYVDLAYSWHQYEQGLHWGGAVDEFATWCAQPWDIYQSARTAYDGTPVDLSTASAGKPALLDRRNVIGVQGQLWGETLRNFDQVQYLCLPKIFGLAERGWTAVPEWIEHPSKSFEECRSAYNAKVGEIELPLMKRKGYMFHIGQPGIIVEDGKLKANCQYDGETVRYTFDGSEPSSFSPKWTAPVAVPNGVKVIKAKAYYLGKESVTTYLWIK